MSEAMNSSGGPVLTCWKEIAGYVGKGVRTVQRWEKDIGFPVRRPNGGSKSTVLAFPDEILLWARGQHVTAEEFDTATDTFALANKIARLEAEVSDLRSQLALALSRPA